MSKSNLLPQALVISLALHSTLIGYGSFQNTKLPKVNLPYSESSLEAILVRSDNYETEKHNSTEINPESLTQPPEIPIFDVKVENNLKLEPKVLTQDKPKTEIKKTNASNPAIKPNIPSTPQQIAPGIKTDAKPLTFNNPPPFYPQQARKNGWQGTVILRVLVDEAGKTKKVEIAQSSGHQILDDSAIKTIKQWKFSPATIGNKPITSTILIPVKYQLVD